MNTPSKFIPLSKMIFIYLRNWHSRFKRLQLANIFYISKLQSFKDREAKTQRKKINFDKQYLPATVEEARKVELFAIEKLSRHLNQEPKLKTYLKPYPFPTSHLKICIEFKEKEKTAWGYPSYDDGSLDSVKMENDVISYYRTIITNGKAWEEGMVSPVHPPLIKKEAYQEALDAARNTTLLESKKTVKRVARGQVL